MSEFLISLSDLDYAFEVPATSVLSSPSFHGILGHLFPAFIFPMKKENLL